MRCGGPVRDATQRERPGRPTDRETRSRRCRAGPSRLPSTFGLVAGIVSGRKRRRWVPAGTRRADAERVLADLIRRKYDGAPVPTERLTVGQYLTERWLPVQMLADTLVEDGGDTEDEDGKALAVLIERVARLVSGRAEADPSVRGVHNNETL